MKFRSGFRAHNPMVSLDSPRESRRHSKASLTFLSGIQRAPTDLKANVPGSNPALGPFSRSPETLQVKHGCLNIPCISRTERI